jgi:hypothetical protein
VTKRNSKGLFVFLNYTMVQGSPLTIQLNNLAMSFMFYGMSSSSGKSYLVSGRREQERVAFRVIQHENGKWLLSFDAPSWAKSVEKELCRFAEHLGD